MIRYAYCFKTTKPQKNNYAIKTSPTVYSKPMDPKHLPAPIKWGIDNEGCACKEYKDYMNVNGHKGLITKPCGFVVHPTQGWLGASPDAFVFDPTNVLSNGIVEFKCPYSTRPMIYHKEGRASAPKRFGTVA